MAKGLGLGALGCGMQAMKYFLFIVNLLFTLIGMGLVGVSGWVLSELGNFKDAFADGLGYAQAVPIVGIVLGLFILIGASLGCIGAIKENTCCIKVFLAFLIITMLIEAALTVVVIVYNNDADLQNKLDGYMKEPFNECVGLNAELPQCGWALTLQDSFSCCGYDDGLLVTEPVADLCFGDSEDSLVAAQAKATQYCNTAIVADLNSQLATVAGVLGGILALEILLVIGTCCLICGINGDNKYA